MPFYSIFYNFSATSLRLSNFFNIYNFLTQATNSETWGIVGTNWNQQTVVTFIIDSIINKNQFPFRKISSYFLHNFLSLVVTIFEDKTSVLLYVIAKLSIQKQTNLRENRETRKGKNILCSFLCRVYAWLISCMLMLFSALKGIQIQVRWSKNRQSDVFRKFSALFETLLNNDKITEITSFSHKYFSVEFVVACWWCSLPWWDLLLQGWCDWKGER